MSRGVFITGTDTDVGKTVVSAGIMYLLRSKGYNASYFKAALSGAIREKEKLVPGDSRFVKELSGLCEEYCYITPYIYETPVSPHLAGRIEKNPLKKEKVIDTFNKLKSKYDYIVAEGAGGIFVPLNDEGYMMPDLIKDLNMEVILVSRAGVGTINHTTLSVKALENMNIKVRGIIINGFDKNEISHRDNVEIIKKLNNVPILGIIQKISNVNVEKLEFGTLKEEFEDKIKLDEILFCMKEI